MSCVDPGSYLAAESTRAGAAIISAIAKEAVVVAEVISNYNALRDAYKEENKIAKRSQNIAESKQGRLVGQFWPRELSFLGEFGVRDTTIETAEARGRRHSGHLTASVAGVFAKKIHEEDCRAPRYATSAKTKTLQDLLIMRSTAVTSAKVMGRMIGFEEWQDELNLNDKRRLQSIGLKDGLVGVAAQLYTGAANTYAGVGNMAGANLSNAIETGSFLARQAVGDVKTSNANVDRFNRQQEGLDNISRWNDATGRNLNTDINRLSSSRFADVPAANFSNDMGFQSGMSMSQDIANQVPSITPQVSQQTSLFPPAFAERFNDGAVGFRDKSFIPLFPVGITHIDMLPAI